MRMKKEVINVSIDFIPGKGGIFPVGQTQTMRIVIMDESAVFSFKNQQYARPFTQRQIRDGIPSKYIERLQKCVCSYSGLSKEEIYEKFKRNFSALNNKKIDWPEVNDGN